MSETGHPINLANFKRVIVYCVALKDKYAPSRAALKVANLNSLFAAAETVAAADRQLVTAFNRNVNARMLQFRPLKPFCTRLLNGLSSTDASVETVKDARTIVKKILGQRALGGKKDEPPVPVAEDAAVPKPGGNSVSQLSYDNVVENFALLVQTLVVEDNYQPNEAEMKPAALTAKLAELQAGNLAVVNAQRDYNNNLIERNKLFYAEKTGLVDVALDVKKYVLSVYAASSPEYKAVKGISFRNIRK